MVVQEYENRVKNVKLILKLTFGGGMYLYILCITILNIWDFTYESMHVWL